MGKNIMDHKYMSILFGSLLLTYKIVLHGLNTAAHLTKMSVMPDTVICLVTNKYDCRVMKKGHESDNEAFMATTQNKWKKCDIKCHNCHKGHIKAECWAKGGSKEGQGPRRGGMARGSMTAVTAETDIEVWALMDKCTDTESKSSCWVEDSENQDEVWATLEEPESDKEDELAAAAGRSCTSTVEVELYDSRASCHMSPSCDKFSSYRLIEPQVIATADSQVFYVIGIGNMEIDIPNNRSSTRVVLQDALHMPDIGPMIVSISQIIRVGCVMLFEGDSCYIKNKKGKVTGKIPCSTNGLFKVEHQVMTASVEEHVSILTLHHRLGHISPGTICSLICHNIIKGMKITDDNFTSCNSCNYAKTTHKPIKAEHVVALATTFREEVHSDVWGPLPLNSLGGQRYYITITDDYSQYTWAQLLKTKDKAIVAYKAFAAWAWTQHRATICHLQSDHRGDYTRKVFTKFLQEQGMEQWLTTHDMPEHNGVTELLNCHLLEHICAMLHQSGLPKMLWGEALNHTIWLKNHSLM
jgi:hypothetical protein